MRLVAAALAAAADRAALQAVSGKPKSLKEGSCFDF